MKIIPLSLALLTLSISAQAANMKQAVESTDAPPPLGVYSQGIAFDNTLYISGEIPINPATGALVTGDKSTEIKQVFENLKAIAKENGGDLNDMLKLTIYVTDLNYFTEINQVMEHYFTKPYPARSVIQVQALPKNAPLEIDGIMINHNAVK